jgi:hypothetical protein
MYRKLQAFEDRANDLTFSCHKCTHTLSQSVLVAAESLRPIWGEAAIVRRYHWHGGLLHWKQRPGFMGCTRSRTKVNPTTSKFANYLQRQRCSGLERFQVEKTNVKIVVPINHPDITRMHDSMWIAPKERKIIGSNPARVWAFWNFTIAMTKFLTFNL